MTLRILIADGDADLRQVFREYFAELGCAAEVVSDSAACLGVLRRFRPEALVIDADLPGGAQSVLSHLEQVNSLRRVVVTGGEGAEELAESVVSTASCSLRKPFRLLSLVSALAFAEPTRSARSNGASTESLSVCAPLVGQDGSMLGVLQMASSDHHRRFSQADVDLLAGVVSQAALAIETAHQQEEATKRRDLDRQLEFASQVQMSFLPNQRPQIPGYGFYDYYEAALGIGGDFFDYVPLPDGRLVVALGDVAGKGVPAALLMARLHSMARYHFLAEPTPARVLSELNAGLATCGLGHRFVTFVAAVLDPRRHEVTLVNAGHIPPLLVRPGGEIELVGGDASGLPLGICHNHDYGQFTLPLDPGDALLLFTDGVTEAMSGDDELYGIARVRGFVAQPHRSVEDLGAGLVADVEAFSGGRRQCDDICVVGLQRRDEG